jgi:hypothetical protein
MGVLMNTIDIQTEIVGSNIVATLNAYSEFNNISKEVTLPDNTTITVQGIDYTGITPVETQTVTIARPSSNTSKSDDVRTLLESTEWQTAKTALGAE